MYVLIKSLVIGFLLSAPIGPIGILCIDTTLNRNKTSGLTVGFGSSVAGIVLILSIGLGLTALIHIYDEYYGWFRILGGILLCYLGLKIFLSHPASYRGKYLHRNYLRIFLFSFIITLISPSTLILFAVLFAKLRPFDSNINYLTLLLASTGIFAGSMLWWIILTNLVCLFKSKFESKFLKTINIIASLTIILLGLITIFQV